MNWTYAGEFRKNSRFLAAAAIGTAAGYSIIHFVNNIFIPQLMAEFGWEKSSIALIGVTYALSLVFSPMVGRLVDKVGAKVVAGVGISLGSLIYLLLSFQQGPLWQFFALSSLQIILVATTTTTLVYSRLIAGSFVSARGLALAFMGCAPSLAGALIVPFLSDYLGTEGWRAGYRAMAIYTALGGALALLLIPRSSKTPGATAVQTGAVRRTSLRELCKHPAFALILMAMGLGCISLAMQTSQLKLIVLSFGVEQSPATLLVSVFAVGVILGRILCGLALDMFPTHLVAALSVILPGLGMLLMATEPTSLPLLVIAILSLGFSMGAESDIISYAVMKYFGLEVFGTAMGFAVGVSAASAALGAVILGVSLKITGGYTSFMVLTAIAYFLAALMFWRLKYLPVPESTSLSPAAA